MMILLCGKMSNEKQNITPTMLGRRTMELSDRVKKKENVKEVKT